MKTAAVMVAAGLSSRMKSFKPMLQLAGSTVIKTALSTLKSAGVSVIVVVTGNNAQELEKHVEDPRVVCVHNRDYAATDMFHSASMGLSEARNRADRTFFLPADVPLFSKQSLLTMMGYMDYSNCDILVPTHKGKGGHPLLIKNAAIAELLAFGGEGGLRKAVQAYGGKREYIELPDMGTILDADRPEDYALLRKYAEYTSLEQPITCAVGVRFDRKEPFFGDDTAILLEHVSVNPSLSRACRAAGVSYSKGWKSIKIAESQFGFPILDSFIGGATGGGSNLTDEGKALLTTYRAFKTKVERFAEIEFHRHFSDYQKPR